MMVCPPRVSLPVSDQFSMALLTWHACIGYLSSTGRGVLLCPVLQHSSTHAKEIGHLQGDKPLHCSRRVGMMQTLSAVCLALLFI